SAMIMFALMNLAFVGMLFVAMLALQEVGRRLAERATEAGSQKRATSATEAAVYGILGLFLAFTFSGAGLRFEERRHLAVEQSNAVATAGLRIDTLPASAQPRLRHLFRQYIDARLERAPRAMNEAAVASAVTKYQALQREVWSAGGGAAHEAGQGAAFCVFLAALNDMICITAPRETVARMRTPLAVTLMVAMLALIGSLFAGYD